MSFLSSFVLLNKKSGLSLDRRTGGKGYGDAGGFSTSRAGKEGAFGTFGEGRGRKDYSKGGLATMFKEKR